MKGLLRLYPRSWRKRYGGEMEVLMEDMTGKLSIALDLLIGAAVAYRDVIRANRILSARRRVPPRDLRRGAAPGHRLPEHASVCPELGWLDGRPPRPD